MQCVATTHAGAQCRKDALKGGDRCAAHMHMLGKDTSLTAALIEQLCVMLRAGNYLPIALRALNVNAPTFNQWMRKGRVANPANELYGELRREVEKARAEGEVRNVAQIARAASESWQAAAWLLERQYPDRWGKVSVRLRDEAAADEQAKEATAKYDDPFAEVDQLAERRAARGA